MGGRGGGRGGVDAMGRKVEGGGRMVGKRRRREREGGSDGEGWMQWDGR